MILDHKTEARSEMWFFSIWNGRWVQQWTKTEKYKVALKFSKSFNVSYNCDRRNLLFMSEIWIDLECLQCIYLFFCSVVTDCKWNLFWFFLTFRVWPTASANLQKYRFSIFPESSGRHHHHRSTIFPDWPPPPRHAMLAPHSLKKSISRGFGQSFLCSHVMAAVTSRARKIHSEKTLSTHVRVCRSIGRQKLIKIYFVVDPLRACSYKPAVGKLERWTKFTFSLRKRLGLWLFIFHLHSTNIQFG